MKIETKLDVGDDVFYIKYIYAPHKGNRVCPVCNGAGRFTGFSGSTRVCPGVTGYECIDGKMAESFKNFAVVKKSNVCRIDIEVDETKEVRVLYDVGEDFSWEGFNCNNLYKTREEAQAICDAENSKKGLL